MRFLGNLVRGAYRMVVNIVGFLCFLVMTGVVIVGVLVGYPPAQDFLQDAVHQGEKVKKEIGDRLA
jgi:hypothetical protein